MEPQADYVFVASHCNIIEPDIYVSSYMRTKAKTSLDIFVVSPMYLLPRMSVTVDEDKI